jgi:hypothetical protein
VVEALMSRGFMLLIGLLQLGAALSALFERKWLWALVMVCYGISGIALCILADNEP